MGEDVPEGLLPPAKDKTLPIPSQKKPTEEKTGTGDKVVTKDKPAEKIKMENGSQQEKEVLASDAKVKEEPAEESQEKKSEPVKLALTPNATQKAAKEAKSAPTPPVSNRPRRQVRKQEAEGSNSK